MTETARASRKVVSSWANPVAHSFKLESTADLHVYAVTDEVATELSIGVDYSVDDVGEDAGYSVTLLDPADWASADSFVLDVTPPINQPDDVDMGGSFGARFEEALDKLSRRMMSISDMATRAIKSPLYVDPASLDQRDLEIDPEIIANSEDLAAAVEAAEQAAEQASTVAAALPAIVANTMLVDNAAGNAREAKTFPQVRSILHVDYVPTPYHFGAVGDGSTDDTAAMNAWKAAATDGRLFLPAGKFKTSDAWVFDLDTLEAITIQGAGESVTTIIYTGNATNFISAVRGDAVNNLADDVGVVIDGITFRTTQAGTSTAIKIELEDAAPSAGSYEGIARRVSNCRFIGSGSGYWAYGVRWNNSTYSTTENIMFQGNAAGNTCIVFGGTRSAVDNVIHNVKQVGGGKVIDVENPALEGMYVSSMMGVNVERGINWAVAGFGGPLLTVINSHVATKPNGIAFNLNGIAQPSFSNVCVFLTGNNSIAYNLQSDLGVLGNMGAGWASCTIFGVAGTTGKKGVVVGAGCRDVVVGGIAIIAIETGVEIASGALRVTLLPSLHFRINVNNIVDNTPGSGTSVKKFYWPTENDYRMATGDDTGVHLSLENTSSAALTTKFVQLIAYGRDTTNALRDVGKIRWTPVNNDWTRSQFDIYTRSASVTASRFTIDTDGNILFPQFARVNNAAGGLGFATGAGGAVTQITSRTTGVTLDKPCGAITLVSAAGSATFASFTVTNSTVAVTDTIIINQKSGTDLYEIHVTAVAAGSFRVSFRTTGGTTVEQPVFNFAVIKAVAA